MNWEAVAAIGEITGAAAVVVSIVYLSIQVRSNTQATRANASFDAAHSWAQFNEHMISVPDDVLALELRTFDPLTRIEDLSDVEYMRVSIIMRTIFQKLEGQYYLYRYGSLEAAVWENRRSGARGIIELPIYRVWWENEVQNRVYSDEFVQALEAATPVDAEPFLRKPRTTKASHGKS